MGSNLKKIRSLNLNTKTLLVGTIVSLGFLGTFLLDNFLKETYSSRKTKIEEIVERVLNKEVILGDYSGIRFLGFSVGNSKIIDLNNKDSVIKAKSVYVGIMPLRSFLKQKWIVKIRPEKTEIKIDKNFFKRDKPFKKLGRKNKSKVNYDLIFNLNTYSILELKNSGLETKLRGYLIYWSDNNQIKPVVINYWKILCSLYYCFFRITLYKCPTT